MLGNIVKQLFVPPIPEGLYEDVPYCNTAMEREVEERECHNGMIMAGFIIVQLIYIAFGIVALVLDSPVTNQHDFGCLSNHQLVSLWMYSLISIIITFFLSPSFCFYYYPPPPNSQTQHFYFSVIFTVIVTIPMTIGGAVLLFHSIGWNCVATDLALNQFAFVSWILWTLWLVSGILVYFFATVEELSFPQPMPAVVENSSNTMQQQLNPTAEPPSG